MDYAFRFTAVNSRQRAVAGLIYGPSKALAFAKLRRNGFRPTDLKLAPMATLRNAVAPEFDAKDLSRFYRTLGRRINNGRSLADGLESAAEFVKDEKLKQGALIMRQALNEGRREHEAMQAADFPQRDAMVIRAAAESGKAGDAFIKLSEDVSRVARLRGAVKGVFRMPAIMALVMWAFFFAAIHWMAPKTMEFMKNINAHVSPVHETMFAFVKVFNDNFAAASVLYWLVPVGVVLVARSESLVALVDRIQIVRDISVKADMSSLWSGFALLYEAAIPPAEAAKIIKAAANRRDSRDLFARLEKILATGVYLETGVEKAGFHKFVADGIKAADSGGDTVAGIQDMTRDLEEDVNLMTERLNENMKLGSMALLGVLVLLFFFATYYPIMSAALKNV